MWYNYYRFLYLEVNIFKEKRDSQNTEITFYCHRRISIVHFFNSVLQSCRTFRSGECTH